MEIRNEAQAIEALNAVLVWAKSKPDSSHGGKTTGLTYQRGRVIATWTHDGTVGMSTYPSAADAREKAGEMEVSYRNWKAMRDSRVTVIGKGVTVVRPPDDDMET
jgi:ArsR family metal-binding transcriptional regulator